MFLFRFVTKLLIVVVLIALVFPASIKAATFSRRSPVVEVVEKAGPAVVNIRTEQIVKRRGNSLFGFGDSFFDDFFRGFGPTRVYKTQSLGSGVIIDPRGYVLTNAHVIAQASKIYVALSGEKKEIEAELVGIQEKLDVAVIRIAGEGTFPFLKTGTSDNLILGETVVAIGNPLGLGSSVTTGVISSTHRRVPMDGGFVGHFVQTDALINPGNSGGPLLNVNGELIGINTAIASQAQGIGFSIPIDMAKRVVGDLVQYGEVRKPYLGILPGNVNRALVRSRGVGGVLVTEIEKGSPAEKSGLKIADVVLTIDGMTVESPREMMQLLDSYTPDNVVNFEFLRGTDVLQRQVKLQALPEDYGMTYGQRVFGFTVQPRHGGVVVKKVTDGSHAAVARLRVGDLIAEVAGIEIPDIDTYIAVMEQNIGELPLTFLVVRDNRGYYINLP
jgi:serine protease Do